MTSFDVSVHSSEELYNMVGASAQNRAKTYIEGALNAYSQHTVNVSTPTSGVACPRQKIEASGNDPFTAYSPCDHQKITYDHLGQWWAEYIGCLHPKDGDADLLLTAYDSEAGVCMNYHSAIAEGGQHIPELPSDYDFYGCARCYDAMQTAFHELAHGILDYYIEHHKVGRTPTFNGTNYRSPMAPRGEHNICDEYVAHSKNECNMMAYAECAEKYFNT